MHSVWSSLRLLGIRTFPRRVISAVVPTRTLFVESGRVIGVRVGKRAKARGPLPLRTPAADRVPVVGRMDGAPPGRCCQRRNGEAPDMVDRDPEADEALLP